MRKWIIIAVAALAALSCSRQKEQDLALDETEGKVEVVFSVTGEQMETKTLGEAHQLETMHIAVFGGSGYLKEYVPATLLSTGTYEYEYYDASHELKKKIVPKFTYTVRITLSNSSRRVHFIGNGPASITFGKDYEVLPTLLGEKETGYWQMIELEHITALKDGDGDYLTPVEGGEPRKRQQGEPYIASDELKQAFSCIPLIRNWAKIELRAKPAAESNFTPISFAVVNVPKHGTLVPYGGVKGFITNYKDLSFDDLRSEEYDYGGNLPASVKFDDFVPAASDFEKCENGAKRYLVNPPADNEDYAVYLYERPVPDANIPPSYVIVYGKYYNPDDLSSLTDEEIAAGGAMCYYKVDLMTGSEYYPVLRNFKYLIKIDKISARGHNTPEEAANAAGSADVSADINASSLPDISDGTRRMAIQYWMSKTFIHAETKQEQLYVTFFNDINGDNPAPNLSPAADGCVTYELIPASAGIVKDVEIGEAEADPTHSNYGWRPISFAIASPDEAAGRTQTLRIKCKVNPDDENESPLYRDVVISLLPTQPMRVNCKDSRVLLVTGEKQQVDVDIPDGLVESMFPLHFIIEAEKLTLTPDTSVEGNDLPVISETSIIGDYPSFHFQRTVEWSEYKSLEAKLDYEDDSRWRTFSSYFKTNCEHSATYIYVANEYFKTGRTSFSNYSSFRDPKFTTPISLDLYSPVNVSAKLMVDQQPYVPVYLILQGLQPAAGSGITWDDTKGMYKYTPTSSEMSFLLETRVKTGDVSVTLVSEDASYEPAVLTPWRFWDAKVLDLATPNGSTHTGGNNANVVAGHVNSAAEKKFLVGYYLDPTGPKPQTTTIKDLHGAVSDDGKTSWNDDKLVSDTAQELYREKWMKTEAGMDPVSLTLSAVGYVEEFISAPRFKGHIYSYDFRSANDWNSLISNIDSQDDDVYDYRIQKTVSVEDFDEKGKLTLEVTGNKPIQAHGSPTDGIVLPAGGHYEIEVNIGSDHNDIFLFYNQLFYHVDNGTTMKPRSVDPYPDGSIYYGYQGNNKEFIWSLPLGESGGKLVIDALSGRDIVINRIISRGFHGILNTTGDTGGGDIGLGEDLSDGGSL
jgi:hypothetical protein